MAVEKKERGVKRASGDQGRRQSSTKDTQIFDVTESGRHYEGLQAFFFLDM